MTFLGIDVHLRSFMVACIDMNMHIELIDKMNINDLMNYVSNNNPHIIAVDAPYGLNKGLMNDAAYRSKLNKNLKGHYNKKVSEYELSRRGIIPFSTPGNITEITGWKLWMKTGFELYDRLADIGYEMLNEKNDDKTQKGLIEVFPHASFTTLAGRILESKSTEEGLEERVNVLEMAGISNVRGKITGSKHIRGDKLDALVAAYTALSVYKGNSTFLRDIDEGQIAVPVKEVKDKYKRAYKKVINETIYNGTFSDTVIISKQYRYVYENVDSVIWLKYFSSQQGSSDIYSLVNFSKKSGIKVNAVINSLDEDRTIKVVLEPIKGSIHGMKAVKEYKESLKGFWGSHGDRKKYLIDLSIIEE